MLIGDILVHMHRITLIINVTYKLRVKRIAAQESIFFIIKINNLHEGLSQCQELAKSFYLPYLILFSHNNLIIVHIKDEKN